MTDKIEPSGEQNPFRDIKAGDRLWICNASEPSDFQILLSDVVGRYPKYDKTETVFYVSSYSFHGSDAQVKFIINSPPKAELPYDALIYFIPLEKEMSIEIPNPQTSVTVDGINEIRHIVIDTHKFTLQKQTFLESPIGDR